MPRNYLRFNSRNGLLLRRAVERSTPMSSRRLDVSYRAFISVTRRKVESSSASALIAMRFFLTQRLSSSPGR